MSSRERIKEASNIWVNWNGCIGLTDNGAFTHAENDNIVGFSGSNSCFFWSTVIFLRKQLYDATGIRVLPCLLNRMGLHRDFSVVVQRSGIKVVTSIKNILAGQCSVSRDVRDMYSASIATEESGSTQILTKRQREVVELLSAGLCNKLIANKLNISESTTKQHVSFAIHALGARNRTDAVIKAQHLGLIPAIHHAGLAGTMAR